MENFRITAAIALLILLFSQFLWAHSEGVTGTHVMSWHNDSIDRVVAPSFSWNNLDMTLTAPPDGEDVTIAGRSCMRASALNVDVRDSYGFDLDETVTLTLEIDAESSPADLVVRYDRVGGPGTVTRSLDESGLRFQTLEIDLERARLANRSDHSTDLVVTANTGTEFGRTPQGSITICNIELERSFESVTREAGWLNLSLLDASGNPTQARLGLYSEEGSMPIPSEDAVEIRKFDDHTHTYLLQTMAPWPHENRFIFYADGRYQARVPEGRYRLIAAKGIEYRVLDLDIEIIAGETTSKSIQLERFVDMPSLGWYSGDVHIHNLRNTAEDSDTLLAQSSAEDLHVANILRMGNVGQTYFPQIGFGEAGRAQNGNHALVPGQEDPRTLTLGHTIHLDILTPIRFPDDYLNYRRVFEEFSGQGGISGFAHAAGGLQGTREGMVMQAAFGLLDFAEIMQGSSIGTAVWYDLLNLGYRVTPAAGTDYPYIGHPGAERTYVEMGAEFSVDAWFTGFEQGRTFVTNGPLVNLSVNGQPIGSEVQVSRGEALDIEAGADLNPDIGTLNRLELIKYGEVVATTEPGSEVSSLRLQYSESATESGWYVLRAVGQREGHSAAIEAITAPIYVVVDDQERTWNAETAAAIAERHITLLEAVKNRSLATLGDSEAWHSMPVWAEEFPAQLESASASISEAQQRLSEVRDAANSQ